MNPLARAALPALLLPLGLAACAGERDNGYPSLAKRPVEARGFDEPAALAALPPNGSASAQQARSAGDN